MRPEAQKRKAHADLCLDVHFAVLHVFKCGWQTFFHVQLTFFVQFRGAKSHRAYFNVVNYACLNMGEESDDDGGFSSFLYFLSHFPRSLCLCLWLWLLL